MIPYYDDGVVVVYKGDCRQILQQLPADSVQLVATSPPYNVGLPYRGYRDRKAWPKWYRMMEESLYWILQVLRPGGIMALNLPLVVTRQEFNDNGTETAPRSRAEPVYAWAHLKAKELGFLLRESLIWVKSSSNNPEDSLAFNIMGQKDKNPYMRDVAEGFILASKSTYHMQGKPDTFTIPFEWCKNMWVFKRAYTNDFFPMWPIKLCDRLISMFSEPGDTILDCYAGSGLLLHRAKILGRKAIGIEISEHQCRQIAFRCAQLPMFTSILEEVVK